MSQCATVFGASAPDRLSHLIQQRVFGDRVKIPLEIRLWGGRTDRCGDAEPAVKILFTCRAWAENLEAAREDIIARWGETLYRRFRLYLWGSALAFLSRSAEAFRVVLERPLDA